MLWHFFTNSVHVYFMATQKYTSSPYVDSDSDSDDETIILEKEQDQLVWTPFGTRKVNKTDCLRIRVLRHREAKGEKLTPRSKKFSQRLPSPCDLIREYVRPPRVQKHKLQIVDIQPIVLDKLFLESVFDELTQDE